MDKPKKFAVADQLIGNHFEGLDIRIVDLARESLQIQNKTFVNCRIYGPAVVNPEGCDFRDIGWHVPINYYDKAVETIYIPLPNRDYLSGIIYLKDITFRNCDFKDISFIGPRQLEQNLKQALRSK